AYSLRFLASHAPSRAFTCVGRTVLPNRVLPTAVALVSRTLWVTWLHKENRSRRFSLKNDRTPSFGSSWNVHANFPLVHVSISLMERTSSLQIYCKRLQYICQGFSSKVCFSAKSHNNKAESCIMKEF